MIAWRTRTDPLADDAVLALERPRPGENVLERVKEGARGGNVALQRFLDETAVLPPWYYAADFEAGRRAALRHAPITFLVLLAGSLVESFAIANGASVLVRTGRLLRNTYPRILETASLVRDILLEGEERPGGRAHASLLRVRLLHAAVRRFVSKTPGWSDERYGRPVNQMDMLHTLLMFSRVVARGVNTMGGRFDDEERASWCALWRYAGFMIGVDEMLLPKSVDDEANSYTQIRGHYSPDEGSRALANAVLDALRRKPPFYLPRPALDALSRKLLDDDLADQFGIPRSRRWSAFTSAIVGAWSAKDLAERVLPLGKDVGAIGGRAFIEVNRWRVLRSMPEADYSFRTA